jgi:hypothetical protein
MHEKANPSVAEREAEVERAVMRLLLEDRGLFTFGEINQAVGGKTIFTADAIARLKRGRLIHECLGFHFASHSAVVAVDLWGDG